MQLLKISLSTNIVSKSQISIYAKCHYVHHEVKQRSALQVFFFDSFISSYYRFYSNLGFYIV